MRLLIASAIFALSAGAAFAQGAPDIVARLDTNQDGALARTEFGAMVDARFNMADADHNGSLSRAEGASVHGQAVDTQSREEYSAQAMGMFDGHDTNRDGQVAGDELEAFRSHFARGVASMAQQQQQQQH